MLHYIAVLLATFFIWETLRYIADTFVPLVFAKTRAVHPLVVAAFPVTVLWPDYVGALAVAGGMGILHLAVERYLVTEGSTPIQVPRRTSRMGGLPPLP